MRRFRYTPLNLSRWATSQSTFSPSTRTSWMGGSAFQQMDNALRHASTIGSQQASRIYNNVLSSMLSHLNTRNPHLNQFTGSIRYNPGYFSHLPQRIGNYGTPPRDWKAATGGWLDVPGNPPITRVNNNAFRDAQFLGLVVGHEIGHLIQRNHPQIYRGEAYYEVQPGDNLSVISRWFTGQDRNWQDLYDLNQRTIGSNPNQIRPGQRLLLPTTWGGLDDGWQFREFDATLRDLEGIHRLGAHRVSAFDQLSLIRKGNYYLRQLEQGDAHWNRLLNNPNTSFIPDNLQNRWETARDKAWRQLQWQEMPGVLDLPQLQQYFRPQPQPWNQPFGFG
jgi:hypothetical protein